MAEVSWKATFIGALMLFLIGIVVATCLNYAEASIISIKAGISGPYKCHYNNSSYNESQYKINIMCNDTDLKHTHVQTCVYIWVSYTNSDGSKVSNIKLSPDYRHNNPQHKFNERKKWNPDGTESLLGECSAEYCGNYRFKKSNSSEYMYHPDLITGIDNAVKHDGGYLDCYLNPDNASAGAYLNLNGKVKSAEERIFRWYEGWLIIMAPVAITVAILIYLVVMLLKGRLQAANSNQRTADTFVPPGFAPIITTQESENESSNELEHEEDEPKFI